MKFELENKRKPIVALLGLAFKPNINDLRESPAVFIAQKVQQNYPSDKLIFVEPNIMSHDKFPISLLKDALVRSDINFILVNHNEFNYIDSKNIVSFC